MAYSVQCLMCKHHDLNLLSQSPRYKEKNEEEEEEDREEKEKPGDVHL